VYYLHTLDGLPAGYNGYQITFATVYGGAVRLCKSLKEIQEQRRESEKWRTKRGFPPAPRMYDYRRVRMPK
jgi:hypothetical protein